MFYIIAWFLCGVVGVLIILGLDKFLLQENATFTNIAVTSMVFLMGPAGIGGVLFTYFAVMFIVNVHKKRGV